MYVQTLQVEPGPSVKKKFEVLHKQCFCVSSSVQILTRSVEIVISYLPTYCLLKDECKHACLFCLAGPEHNSLFTLIPVLYGLCVYFAEKRVPMRDNNK